LAVKRISRTSGANCATAISVQEVLSREEKAVTGEDIGKLFETPAVKQSMLNLYGPEACVLILLYRLNVVGVRRVSYSMISTLIGSSGHVPPPCSIQQAIVTTAIEYLQFCPKRLGDEEFKR